MYCAGAFLSVATAFALIGFWRMGPVHHGDGPVASFFGLVVTTLGGTIASIWAAALWSRAAPLLQKLNRGGVQSPSVVD